MKLLALRDITKHDIYNICVDISASNTYKLIPSKEAGLSYYQENKEIKSVVFNAVSGNINWPHVGIIWDIMWSKYNDIVIEKNTVMTVDYGILTEEELNTLIYMFKFIGLTNY